MYREVETRWPPHEIFSVASKYMKTTWSLPSWAMNNSGKQCQPIHLYYPFRTCKYCVVGTLPLSNIHACIHHVIHSSRKPTKTIMTITIFHPPFPSPSSLDSQNLLLPPTRPLMQHPMPQRNSPFQWNLQQDSHLLARVPREVPVGADVRGIEGEDGAVFAAQHPGLFFGSAGA